VRADAALMERAVANVVANALQASPPDRPVRIFAGAAGERETAAVSRVPSGCLPLSAGSNAVAEKGRSGRAWSARRPNDWARTRCASETAYTPRRCAAA